MAEKLGDVYYVAHIRGDDLNREAKAAGDEAGENLGKSARKSFDKEMSKLSRDLHDKFDREGKLAGSTFSRSLERQLRGRRESLSDELARIFSDRDTFDKFLKESDSVGDGLDRLTAKIKKARQEQILTNDEMKSLTFTANNWSKRLVDSEREQNRYNTSLANFREELDRVGTNHQRVTEAFTKAEVARNRSLEESRVALKEHIYDYEKLEETFKKTEVEIDRNRVSIDRHTRSVRDNNRSMREMNKGWGSIPHNGRQAILIVAAVAASFEQLATLGSAAGAGLGVVGGAILALLPAAGVLVGGILSLANTFKKAKEGQIGYVDELRKLGTAFVDLGSRIEKNLFTPLTAGFANFRTNILPRLETSIQRVAAQMGTTLAGALDRLSSPQAVKQFNDVLALTGPLFDKVANAALNLNSALAGFTVAAGPSILRFGDWLERITGQFDRWVNSLEGQNAIAAWLNNGIMVLSAFNNLLVEASKMLARLVTPTTVRRTVEFLDHLADSMPFLEGIARVLGELDIFGLFAQILDDVGNALVPLLKVLEPVASILGEVLTAAIQGLGVALKWLSPLFIPLQVAFDLWNYAIEQFLKWSQPLLEALGLAGDSFTDVGDRIFQRLLPSFAELVQSFIELLPPQEEVVAFIKNELIPGIERTIDWVVNYLVPALQNWYRWFDTYIIPVIKMVIQWISGFNAVVRIMADIITGVVNPALIGFRALWDTLIAPIARFVSLGVATLQPFINTLNTIISLMGAIIGYSPKVNQAASSAASARVTPRTATGGTFYTPQIRQIAEAGAEMVVPLQRPLSQVDPSVRQVAAFARGLPAGGTPAKNVNIESGAFVITTPTENPVLVASMVMDEIVEVALN